MPEVALSALDPGLQKLATQVRTSLEQGNHDFVIAASRQILAAHPGCLVVRRWERQARIQKSPRGRSFLGRAKGGLKLARGLWGQKKTSPDAAASLTTADAILALDPWSAGGLKQLAAAAAELDLPATEIFAFQCWCEAEPDNREAGLALTAACLRVGDLTAAMAAVEVLRLKHPHDGDVQEALRNVAVAQTVQTGRWDEGGASFRDQRRE
ncbi:hypothetical protein [Synoicihabitans lomoniglobus]|uniref:Tetratricopeptide repeat protein n=1 Tax=Synoicihabitans lomoniglobus TaxID=2909285 RepID=A0AAF0I5R5_9BACT|nr:hypothetical protein [Opitutaceae bacterium LMO-M01]WED67170.1 hypothetical protein PXH66_09930 [Opitutaceae bacterium LMO-M01]